LELLKMLPLAPLVRQAPESKGRATGHADTISFTIQRSPDSLCARTPDNRTDGRDQAQRHGVSNL
jgi:hypothetical protein